MYFRFMDDVMFAHSVPSYIATRTGRALKVAHQAAAPGAESAVSDCLATLSPTIVLSPICLTLPVLSIYTCTTRFFSSLVNAARAQHTANAGQYEAERAECCSDDSMCIC